MTDPKTKPITVGEVVIVLSGLDDIACHTLIDGRDIYQLPEYIAAVSLLSRLSVEKKDVTKSRRANIGKKRTATAGTASHTHASKRAKTANEPPEQNKDDDDGVHPDKRGKDDAADQPDKKSKDDDKRAFFCDAIMRLRRYLNIFKTGDTSIVAKLSRDLAMKTVRELEEILDPLAKRWCAIMMLTTPPKKIRQIWTTASNHVKSGIGAFWEQLQEDVGDLNEEEDGGLCIGCGYPRPYCKCYAAAQID